MIIICVRRCEYIKKRDEQKPIHLGDPYALINPSVPQWRCFFLGVNLCKGMWLQLNCDPAGQVAFQNSPPQRKRSNKPLRDF